jgi:hypothetical protein
MQDGELKAKADADVYTLAEHLRTMIDSIFTEWKQPGKVGDYSNRKPYISSFRRNLQRMALKQFASMVNSPHSQAPEDARTLARMHLAGLEKQITTLLATPNLKLDDYSQAHLLDSQERIRKALAAEVQLHSID